MSKPLLYHCPEHKAFKVGKSIWIYDRDVTISYAQNYTMKNTKCDRCKKQIYKRGGD